MKIIAPLKAKCRKCGFVFDFEFDDEMDCVSTYERNMGTESEYEAACQMSCPNCGEDVYARISAWEYPEGDINHTDIIYDGIEVLQEPEYQPYSRME